MEPVKLPDIIGVSTSSFQVESEYAPDGTLVDSNWTRWTRSPQRTRELEEKGMRDRLGLDNFRVGRGCEFDTRYAQDLKLWSEHGLNGARISFNWPRIQPHQDRFEERELLRCRDMLEKANALGMNVAATLWHWNEPGWADDIGSWENPDMPHLFARYVEKVMEYVGDLVSDIIPLNEPTVHAMFTRRWRRWLNYRTGEPEYFHILEQLSRAHALATTVIRRANPNAQIGIAQAACWNVSDVPSLKKEMDRGNYGFIDQILELAPKSLDWIGLNVYFKHETNRGNESKAGWDGHGATRSAPCDAEKGTRWGMSPQALYELSKEFWHRYQLPIAITEHGYPTEGDHSKQCMETYEAIKWLAEAMHEGVPVRGLYLWAGLSNFEWGEGWFADFGYVGVDRTTQERTPRPALLFIRDCVKAGSITEEVVRKWAHVMNPV